MKNVVKVERISGWLDRIMEFSMYALLFSATFSKSMIEIFFVIAFVCWTGKRLIEFKPGPQFLKTLLPVKTRLNLPIYGFIFAGFLSMVTSVSLSLSLEGFFCKLMEWVLIYFIVVESIDTKKKLNRMVVVICGSIILMIIDGFFQRLTGIDFIRQFPRVGPNVIKASFGNPNAFGAWLILMVSLSLSFAWFYNQNWVPDLKKYSLAKKVMKPVLWIVALLLFLCMAMTQSRGAWVAALIAVILIGIFRSKKLLISTLIVLMLLPFVVPNSIRERAVLLVKPAENTTSEVSFRVWLWKESLAIVKDYPVFGSGLNTYATVAPKYKSKKSTGFYPHNSYLHMAAEAGLVGLGAFLWILLTLFSGVFRKLKKIRPGFYGTLFVGLAAGLFGFLAHSFVEVNLYALDLGALMWFFMGLVIVVERVALPNAE